MKDKKIAHLPVTIERNDNGFLANCPLIQGAFAEGDTIEEAIFNCLDVVKMIVEYRDERGEPVLKGDLEELKAEEMLSFTVQRLALVDLVERGVLRQRGRGKGGRFELVE